MAMSLAMKLTTFVVLMCMVVGAPLAQAITCGQVASSVAPCISYLRSGGAVPTGCCNGVRSLNSQASNTANRQAVCKCLVSAAGNFPGLNPNRVSGLPSACGVSLPFKISTSTNCNSIK